MLNVLCCSTQRPGVKYEDEAPNEENYGDHLLHLLISSDTPFRYNTLHLWLSRKILHQDCSMLSVFCSAAISCRVARILTIRRSALHPLQYPPINTLDTSVNPGRTRRFSQARQASNSAQQTSQRTRLALPKPPWRAPESYRLVGLTRLLRPKPRKRKSGKFLEIFVLRCRSRHLIDSEEQQRRDRAGAWNLGAVSSGIGPLIY